MNGNQVVTLDNEAIAVLSNLSTINNTLVLSGDTIRLKHKVLKDLLVIVAKVNGINFENQYRIKELNKFIKIYKDLGCTSLEFADDMMHMHYKLSHYEYRYVMMTKSMINDVIVEDGRMPPTSNASLKFKVTLEASEFDKMLKAARFMNNSQENLWLQFLRDGSIAGALMDMDKISTVSDGFKFKPTVTVNELSRDLLVNLAPITFLSGDYDLEIHETPLDDGSYGMQYIFKNMSLSTNELTYHLSHRDKK